MTEGLRTCDCGGTAKLRGEGLFSFYECSKCRTTTIQYWTKEEARDAWNNGPVFGVHPKKPPEED